MGNTRADLNLRARNVGVDPANYPNDSKLEQRIIYEEKNSATEAGSLAVGTLTSTGVASANGDQVRIGDKTYTFRTALTEAKATQTLTSNATAPADGDQVSIGDRTYTFKTTLSTNPTVPNEVLIGASAAAALDNLKLAINGGSTAYPTAADASGAGTTWSTGTVRHEKVIATTNADTTQVVQYYFPGTEGNKLSVGETSANLSWGAPNLAGGVDPVANEVLLGADAATMLDYLKDAINGTGVVGTKGTHYSSNTATHDEVTATTNTNTTQVVQAISYDSGETIVTTDPVDAGSRLSWGAGTLASGTPKVVAQAAVDNAAVSGGARV